MRNDIAVNEVLEKCSVLKQAGLWLPEPKIRPRAWMSNFELQDKGVAAFLLDKFTFYSSSLTDKLLVSSFHSISDGLEKGPEAPSKADLMEGLSSAVITPLNGEDPNPTDSGYLMCRMARQVLDVPQNKIKSPIEAISHAQNGNTVIFLDDFIGSGDQFLTTWHRKYEEHGNISFSEVHAASPFTAIYITLVTTDFGLSNIHINAPQVAVCATHMLTEKSTVRGLAPAGSDLESSIDDFLLKYSKRLRPQEDYIANTSSYCVYGYKNRGLLFGFEHSIPDATLPIFWSVGDDNWEPLIERV